MNTQSSSDEALGALAGNLFVTAIIGGVIMVIVVVWFLVKAFELVARVMVAHPENRPMWVTLGAFVLTASLAAITSGQYLILDVLAVSSFVVLLMVAKVVELYYHQLMLPELTSEYIADQALHHPWWNAA